MLTVAVLLEPGPAPLWPALSPAVQLMLCTPSPTTVSVPLAWVVFKPLSVPTLAPTQLMVRMLARLLALTVPLTEAAVNQPCCPFATGKVSLTTGGSAGAIVNVAGDETPPPGAGLTTVTIAAPGVAMSVA